MRYPLIVQMTPQDNFQGASVLIGQGNWKVLSTHTDSIIQIRYLDNILPVIDGSILELKSATTVNVFIEKAGTETKFSTYLEKQK